MANEGTYDTSSPSLNGIASLLDATVGKQSSTGVTSNQDTTNASNQTTAGSTTGSSNSTTNGSNNSTTAGNTHQYTNQDTNTASNQTTQGTQSTQGTTTTSGATKNTGTITTGNDTTVNTSNHEQVSADTTALREAYAKQAAGITPEMLQAIFQQGSKAAPNLVLAQSNALGSRGVGNTAVAQVLNQLNGDLTSKAADMNRQMLSDSANTAGKIADMTKSIDSSGSTTTHSLTTQVNNLLTQTDSTSIVNQIVNSLQNTATNTSQNNQTAVTGSSLQSTSGNSSQNTQGTTAGTSLQNTSGTQTQHTNANSQTDTSTSINTNAAKDILKAAAAGVGIDQLFRLATGKGFTGNLQQFASWLQTQGGGSAGYNPDDLVGGGSMDDTPAGGGDYSDDMYNPDDLVGGGSTDDSSYGSDFSGMEAYADGGLVQFLPVKNLIKTPSVKQNDNDMNLETMIAGLGMGGGSGGGGSSGSVVPGGISTGGGGEAVSGGAVGGGYSGGDSFGSGSYTGGFDTNYTAVEPERGSFDDLSSSVSGAASNLGSSGLLTIAGLLTQGTPLGAAIGMASKGLTAYNLINKAIGGGLVGGASSEGATGGASFSPGDGSSGSSEDTSAVEDSSNAPQGGGSFSGGDDSGGGTDFSSDDYEGGGSSESSYGGDGGSGGSSCVSVYSKLPSGVVAGDIKVGDTMQLADGETLESGEGVVTYSQRVSKPGYRLQTKSASLACSDSAPIPVRGVGLVLAVDLKAGQEVAVMFNGIKLWERLLSVEAIGKIEVQHITVGDKCFWAGENDGEYILHHNIKSADGGGNLATTSIGDEDDWYADGGQVTSGGEPMTIQDFDPHELLAAMGVTKQSGGALFNPAALKYMTSSMSQAAKNPPGAKVEGRANGGLITGPGTGISDSIPAVGPGGRPLKVSHKEYILPADVTAKLGVQNLDEMVARLHTPAEMQRAITGG